MAPEGTPGSSTSTSTTPSTAQAQSSTNGNGGAPPWVQSLAPDLRSDTSLTRYKDLDTFARSFIGLERKLGTAVNVPGDNATPEERAAFYTKLGRPESPDKYEFSPPAGTDVDDRMVGWFRNAAHEVGLSQAAATKLFNGFIEQAGGFSEASNQAAAAQVAQWDQELKSEWGYAYNRNVQIARQAFEKYVNGDANHPLVKLFDAKGFGSHPAVIKMWLDLGLKNHEDEFVDAQQGPSEADKETASNEIKSILSDRNHPYWKGDQAAFQRMKELNEIVYGLDKP